MHILCIETSTTVCSACVTDGAKVLAIKEVNSGYTHAENLHVFIDEILKEAGLVWKDISAVAVSKGPGSYTGLRIGVSAAKGFCYALNIPLISIDTLRAMTAGILSAEDIYYCPMLDARRMEVYCAVYDKDLSQKLPVQALILDELSVRQFDLGKPICFFGEGMPKAKALLEKIPGATFKDSVTPSAKYMAQLAAKKFSAEQFEDVALFEPFYLKEFFTKKS